MKGSRDGCPLLRIECTMILHFKGTYRDNRDLKCGLRGPSWEDPNHAYGTTEQFDATKMNSSSIDSHHILIALLHWNDPDLAASIHRKFENDGCDGTCPRMALLNAGMVMNIAYSLSLSRLTHLPCHCRFKTDM